MVNESKIVKRETVKVGGKWIKAVRWQDGTVLKPKSVTLTLNEREAATFLPETATMLRKMYGPEVAARTAAAEKAALKLLTDTFVDVTRGWDPILAAQAAELFKGL